MTIAIMLKLCHMRLARPHYSVRNLILNYPTSSRTAIEIPLNSIIDTNGGKGGPGDAMDSDWIFFWKDWRAR